MEYINAIVLASLLIGMMFFCFMALQHPQYTKLESGATEVRENDYYISMAIFCWFAFIAQIIAIILGD